MTHYSNTSNPVDFPQLSVVDRLWGQALDRAVPDTYSSLTWAQVEKIKSVFAELSVRECAKALDDKLSNPDGANMAYCDGSDLLEHFGVES